jgi:CRISPR-associated endonuclease Csn1
MSKKILGLDLGTNSIGWALINLNSENKEGEIIDLGSRIIPMGAEVSNFEQGNPQTKNAERRMARSIRRMGKRYKARRNKLLYILHQAGILPDQFQFSAPFDNPLSIQKTNLLPIRKKTGQLTSVELMEIKVKALTEPIALKEIGRLIFNYNQLRGYSGGGEDEEEQREETNEDQNKEAEFLKYEKIIKQVKILSDPLKQEGKKKGKEYFIAEVDLDGDVLQGETVLNTLKKGDEIELQIIIRRDKKGKVTSINFSMPVKTSWRKSMEELEEELDKLSEEKGAEAYLCEYFLKKLADKNYKTRNKVILRNRYQAEFDAIWDAQVKLNNEFRQIVENQQLLNAIATFIFPGNNPEHKQADYRSLAIEKGLKYLIKEQIIYYQRELKDQSDLIGYCRFEKTERVVPKSHPVFQEFKIWEQINKLSINTRVQKGIKKSGEPKYEYNDVPLAVHYKKWLFDELQKKKEVSGKGLYTKLEKEGAIIKNESFLNGIHKDAKLKGNETLLFLKAQLKDWFEKLKLNESKNLAEFWEILYHAKGNEYDLNSDRCIKLKAFIESKTGETENMDKLVIRFAKIKFARNYASLSLKAVNKLLPLLRAGDYFNPGLPENIHTTIVKILNEKQEDPFLKAVQEVLENYQHIFLADGGMQPSYAAILVYGKHTAETFTGDDIKTYTDIIEIPRGELRNPLAEQLINETLKMVAAIWKQHGEKPDEVRIELARELKNSADERKKIYEANNNNRKINERVKQRLRELNKETSLGNIERYRLWSMQASEPFPFPEKSSEPTSGEIEKMRLWEEQKCISPYTGQPIQLSQLFDKGLYDIDHIIPKSRYFDDSLTNKVICERSVNIDKGNRTAWEYFEAGSITEKLLSKEHFTTHVNQNFFGKKRKNLLSTKIPQDPVARQLKDTQYIATRVREEISKIVGSDNVKTTTGSITDYLRHNWGLTDKFKDITNERLINARQLIKDEEKRNELKWSKRIDHRHHAMDALIVACTEPAHIHRLNNLNKELQDWLTKNKEKIAKDFIGSDEELMEAFLNLAKDKRESLLEEIKGFRNFDHPWKTFSVDSKAALEKTIVSHKPKEKLLIQKAEKGKDAGIKDALRIRGKLHDATLYGLSQGKEAYRIKLSKLGGKQFATEKTIEKIIDPIIKETVKTHLEKYKGNKAEAFSAEGINKLNKERKVPIYGFKIFYKDQSEKLNLKQLTTKKANSEFFNDVLSRMIDGDLKNKIISHVDTMGGYKEAFTESGIKELNKKLEEEFHTKYPNKKFKQVTSVKLAPLENGTEEEELDLSLLSLERKSSYNKNLLVATGSNYAFAVLEKDGNRHYDEISFFDAAKIVNESFKKGNKNIKLVMTRHFQNKNPGSNFLFLLKQNDMVYLPGKEETVILDEVNPGYTAFWNDKNNRSANVYTVVKFSGKTIYFLKHDIAQVLINKAEFGSQNCYEKVNGVSIKDTCVKLKVDRLGNIKPA